MRLFGSAVVKTKRKLLLLGEVHNNARQRAEVEAAVREFQPDVLLHELVYEDEVYSTQELNRRIANAGPHQFCDPRLNIDVYMLARDLNIPLLGCDIDKLKGPTAETFPKRERRMVATLERALGRWRRVAMVVGDAHMRETSVFDLGGSSKLMDYVNDLAFIDLTVVRAPTRWREVK